MSDRVWEWFERKEEKGIHGDKDHHEARCKACVVKRIQVDRAAALDVEANGGPIAPTEEAIRAQSAQRARPIVLLLSTCSLGSSPAR